MKLFYLSSAYFPSEVSHTLSIMRVCQAFADEKHDVVLFGRKSNFRVKQKDVISAYGLKGGFALCLVSFISLLDNRFTRYLLVPSVILLPFIYLSIRKHRPELIYSRLTLLELLAVPRDIPLVFEMHSLGPLASGSLKARLFKYLLLTRNLKHIVVTTDELSSLINKQLPFVKTIKAPLSCELPRMINASELSAFVGSTLQGSAFVNHVGYTGFLDTRGLRGTDIICQTAAITPNVAFHIVGGTREAVSYWKKYSERYNQNGNIFFYGHQNPSLMGLFLSSFCIVLAPLQLMKSDRAPSGMNMSPLKLPQYMSYRKAIVASDIPAHRAILVDNYDSKLVQCDDPSRWSEAIIDLINDKKQRQRIASNAYFHYVESYTPSLRVKAILDVLP